ncbi:MAG: CoA transferase [Chloroflexi bacterium]|nr:CoA transferase [Chloroflexota bacterium]
MRRSAHHSLPTAPLSGLRVVEIADFVAGPYACRLLADAGADVIKIEPPTGDSSRSRGPFPGRTPGPNSSILFHYLNRGKRGLILDCSERQNRPRILELLNDADVLLLDAPASTIDRLNLRYAELASVNPRLIVSILTPFGLTGSKRTYLGDDLITVSAGGLAFASPGLPDMPRDPYEEPPLRANTHIGEYTAGIQAATAVFAGLARRDITGQGCELDISKQEAVAAIMTWEIAHASHLTPKRRNPEVFGSQPNAYLPCKDGYVVVAAFLDHHWRSLVRVMGRPDWGASEVFATSADRARNWDALEPLLLEWTTAHTGEEIAKLAQVHGVPCFPAYGIGQMVDSPQTRSRGFIRKDRLTDGSRVLLPGNPIRVNARRGSTAGLSAPPGNAFSFIPREAATDPWTQRTSAGQAVHPASRDPRKPLAGIRILDFGQLIAVPYATQALAWLGAEVLLVENPEKLTLRGLPPYAEAQPGVNRSGGFNLLNTNKQSICLDLGEARDLQIARELVAVSDVVVENFSFGIMERLGLPYKAARALRPDLIFLSLTAFGRSGPMRNFVGFHSVINLYSGLASVTGYPGGHPRILGAFFPDYFSGCYCVLAILAALRLRARTGRGQFIELAMTEALATVIPEAIAAYGLNYHEPTLVGNKERGKTPHGIYRCAGAQRWVAISIGGNGQWEAFCRSTGHPEWMADPRFRDPEARERNAAELDAVIESWTSPQPAEAAEELLQRAGVPATVVFDSADLISDRHLLQRHFIADVFHPEIGRRRMGTTPWLLNGERPPEFKAAPLLGQHTELIRKSLLQGLPAEKDPLLRATPAEHAPR